MTDALMPLVLIGAGGHAKVVLSLALELGYDVIGVCAPEFENSDIQTWRGIKILGSDLALRKMVPSEVALINGVGKTIGGTARKRIFEEFLKLGFVFPPLVHPRAWVDPTAKLGTGVQVLTGAIVHADAVIGANTIVNTNSSVDHDCIVSDDVHIAPGAVICGGASVEAGAFIGAGSTVIQGIKVGKDSVVAAGSVLVKNLAPQQINLVR